MEGIYAAFGSEMVWYGFLGLGDSIRLDKFVARSCNVAGIGVDEGCETFGSEIKWDELLGLGGSVCLLACRFCIF